NNGIDPSGIDPRHIRIFSNGGGMLPEANSAGREDDLKENAIFVSGEADGVFNQGDYILFYGESPDRWVYDSQKYTFSHVKNIYSDKTYYFLSCDLGAGKRMQTDPGTTASPTNYITKFNDYAFYEQDDINLNKSGREWYDKTNFDVTTSRDYSFSFPNIDMVTPVVVKAVAAARSVGVSSAFTVSVNGDPLVSFGIPSVTDNYLAVYARQNIGSGSFTPTADNFTVSLKYTRYITSAIGYLNYLEVTAMRNLVMSGNQMQFRSILSQGAGKTAEFRLTTQGQTVNVWDVTTTGDAQVIATTFNAGLCTFRVATDSLREFIAFDGNSYYSPEFVGQVANQNLHGADNYDYVIVTHPDLLAEAQRLAQFHRTHDNFNVLVATTEQVYNEFSSGAQDICAIRDFMKMLYDRSGGTNPKYLLLFGDASYDYKNRITGNLNLVPTCQSAESLSPAETYATDDFFAMLHASEGAGLIGSIDLGCGRFPVQTTEEAAAAVNKIIHYCSNTDSVKGNWRNVLCFVADDEDSDLYMEHTETLTNALTAGYPEYNIDKIYLDAFTQTSTPGGQRIPEVNEAINKRMKNGALIMNYIGHGGEVGWAHERVLEVADINSWTNYDKMPVFVTATCEFSRYDDPERVSAGELTFLNAHGGAVTMFTTARPTYAEGNKTLAVVFYNNAFKKEAGSYPRLGDLAMISKNSLPGSANTRKFVLLGDPGLTMAYPNLDVVTTSVNGDTTISADTLSALSLIEISGEVRDLSGSLASDFNGEVYATVFDKPMVIQTLGDNGNAVMSFSVQKNQLYSGKVNVQEGKFSYSFIVPKDISYDFGSGKISYYARSEETDAHGYTPDIVIGGSNPLAAIDEKGPDIELYMNDVFFINGSVTDQNPTLLALVSDESGINTIGNGIGHDITAILDDDTQNPLVLNDYYTADLNTYKSGVITYPLSDLTEGRHHLKLKVWDVYNNSSEAVISFVVAGDDQHLVLNLRNYPNPFKASTTFSFETNQTHTDADIELSIYNMYGMQVKKYRNTLYLDGYRSEPVVWDGKDDNGNRCAAGLYVYQVRVTLPDGTETSAGAKLMYMP
ncbi:MAG TPA: type IX secretion system sortase PorU, partial [Bacteroidales bacterium]|nr:type IX secretion system sortase PorU [Bacteroidales bacterium]